jgi:hypothetical protein
MNRILSPDCYLGVIFHNPKAALWPQVKALVREHAEFVETQPDGTVLAGFTRDPEQVKGAVKVAHIAEGWKKTASFFMNGNPVKSLVSHKWFDCYLGALQCDLAVPYCRQEREVPDADGEGIEGSLSVNLNVQIEVPEGFKREDFYDEEGVRKEAARDWFTVNAKPGLKCVVPCSQVLFGWQRGTPGSIVKQFWAKAARQGYIYCPLFDISAFKVAGEHGERKFTLIGAPGVAR